MFMCKKCGLEKTYDEMKKDKRDINGVSKVCKRCNSEYNKQLRSGERVRVRNTEAERASWPVGMKRCSGCKELLPVDEFGKHASTYDGLMGKCRVCRKEYSAYHYDKWIKSNPERRLWSSAKARAKKENREFTITPEDIVIPDVCPVFGFDLEVNTGERYKDTSPSLDRFDSDKGYTPENIRVISWRANWLKKNMTTAEAQALSSWMSAVDK